MTTDESFPTTDDELASAYLSGDLDPDAEADFERRLSDEPALAERVEAMHALLVDLRGLDDVAPPDGYAERLRARLADEREEEAAPATVVELSRRRRNWWVGAGAAAAAVAAVALIAVVVVPFPRGASGPAEDLAGPVEEAAPLEQTGDDRATTFLDSAESDADEAGREAVAEAPAALPPPSEPVLTDAGAALADSEAVREHFQGLAHVEGLLGVPLEEAEELTARFRLVVQRADAFPSGAHPADCLDVVTDDGSGPLVPAHVETVDYGGASALAYVLVGASAGAEALDRAEVWVVEQATCATREFLTL